MKTYFVKPVLLAAWLFATCFCPTGALGASYVVGISPNTEASQGVQVLQNLLVFMLETALPGDEVSVVDALNQRLVVKLVIPEGKLFQDNARARAQRLAPAMAELKQFIQAERSYSRSMANVIALPQFLDFAASQLRRPGEPLRVIVLASPFYMEASGDGACNMDAAFPSDAHLISDQQRSVFGCALRKNALNGVTVHYAFLNARFLNDYHQERITRFWALYCQQAGGALCSFCPDASIAFRRARENIAEPCISAQLDPADTKVEMRQVIRRGVVSAPVVVTNFIKHVAVTSDVPKVVAAESSARGPKTAPSQPVVSQVDAPPAESVATPPAAPILAQPEIQKLVESFPVKPTGTNKVGVGIAWSASVDLDLWLKANANANDLYWHNMSSREGRYYKDWRNGNMGMDYEYIELNPDSTLDLGSLGCWVNYYEGKATPVRGVVLVFYEGRSYYGEFIINAPSGNKGVDKQDRDQSRYWVRINPAEIVKAGNLVRPRSAAR